MSEKQKRLAVNARVECDGVYGTVKYVGSVAGTNGVWIGVDWDSGAKGKHDGSYKDVRYFSASDSKSGSFIRASKLNCGKSFYEALIDRYENNLAMPSPSLLTLSQNQGTDRMIEFVGFEKVAQKQKNLSQLLVIDLCQQSVSHAGDPSSTNLATVKHLDLSSNLLSSWSEVAKIVSKLPSVDSLVLSGNKLVVADCERLASHFDNVKSLVFGKVGYNWNDVLKVVGSLFRQLNNLDVWGNAIVEITSPPSGIFDHLTTLNLSDNKIVEWRLILSLGHLPLLEGLQLRNCDICEIVFDDNLLPTDEVPLFVTLKRLNLSQNNIRQWTSIANLNRLRSLQELMIKNNPLFGDEKYDIIFNLIIAKIANLNVLNREEITSNQRKEAELYYLKRFHKEWNDEKDSENFVREHPSYSRLLKVYGEPLDSDGHKEKERKFVRLKLKCSFNDKCIEKKLPTNMSIRALRTLMKKLFNIGPFKPFDLVVESSSRNMIKYTLDDELETLHYFSVETGDAIVAHTFM